MPLVSIIIPTYNRAHLVTDAIDSAHSQTQQPLEVIVVDDGSSDGTPELLTARYGDRIRLIQQRNQGPSIARNRGVEAAQGAFIQFCDADDRLHPTKVARCLAQMTPDIALVYSRFRYVDADGRTPLSIGSPELLPEDSFCALLRRNGAAPVQTSTILMRKDAFVAAGGYRADEVQRAAEDWDMLLRLAAHHRFVGLDEVLVDYRYHAGGITHDTLLMAQGRLQTMLYARDYSARQDCIDDRAYDRLLASRYHVLALVQWSQGDRQAARSSLRRAVALAPDRASLRRLFIALSYAFPVRAAHIISRLLSGRG